MTSAIRDWRIRGPKWLFVTLILTTLLCLMATPLTFYVAVMTVMLGDSGQHMHAVEFLIVTAMLWPLLCALGAVLPWVFYRARPGLRLGFVAAPIVYPLVWLAGLYPLAFAMLD